MQKTEMQTEEPAANIKEAVTTDAANSKSRALSLKPVQLQRALSDIWVLRTFVLIGGMISATLLYAYSLLFLYTFLTFGSTTSYFPWAWQAFYTNSGAVSDMTFIGVMIWIVAMVACIVGLDWTYPKFRKSALFSK
jgi:hypothetical protein